MQNFNPAKRYKFSKETMLSNPTMALRYKESSRYRKWVDAIDGQEITIESESLGRVGEWGVLREWCQELPEMGYLRNLCVQVMGTLYGEKKGGSIFEGRRND